MRMSGRPNSSKVTSADTGLPGSPSHGASNTRPNALVRFDPKTETFQSWLIPGGGGIVRHMMPTHDGNIAISMSGLSKVGIVEILPSNSN